MADMTRLDNLVLDPSTVFAIGTGGGGRAQRVYRDGAATEEPVMVDDAQLHKLTGLAVSIGGRGVDGADVQTTTPLESVPAGTVFRAEGRCTLSVRADAKAGWGDRGPRGLLVVTVYIQRLTPVGSVTDLLRQPVAPAARRGGES
jgi:hypothetical protein